MTRDRSLEALYRSYDRSAAGYDERFAALQREKYHAMLPASDGALHRAIAEGPVLDLGCGTGLAVGFARGAGLDPRRWVGVDISAAMLERARGRPLEAVRSALERLPFRDGMFRVVLAFTVVRLLDGEDSPALREIARVLAPGGRLVVTVLAARHDPSFAIELERAGLRADPGRPCGQDIGYVCVR